MSVNTPAPPDLYAVFGNPVAHSRSPDIHAMFAEQTEQVLQYQKRLVPVGEFAQALSDFIEDGGLGLNVTLPFKEDAWEQVATRSQRAEWAGAVNTIKKRWNGELFGDNTDGAGLVADLTKNLGVELAGKDILLLGAGGAARGVVLPLLEQLPNKLVIANRTAQRAHDLQEDFAALAAQYASLDSGGLGMLAGQSYDVIINATSASLSGSMPPLGSDALNEGATCYDMVYSDEPTAFMQWATEHGAATVADGLGMLVEQAAESFYVWRDVRPDTAAVLQQLRSE